MTGTRPTNRARTVTVILVATITVATAGFLTGTSRHPERHGYRADPIAPPAHGAAPRQADVERTRRASRDAQLVAAFAALGEVPRDDAGEIVLGADERARMVVEAAERRAYVGAPPVVPHAVDSRGLPACLVCHEHGMRVNGRVAPAVRHEERASCLQCHAPPSGLPTRPSGGSR